MAGLWAGLRETNSTSQTQAALLEKLLEGQAGLGKRLGALNSSLLLLEDQLHQFSLKDLTGEWARGGTEGSGGRTFFKSSLSPPLTLTTA